MPFFILKAGIHIERNPDGSSTLYAVQRGSDEDVIVESEHDLVAEYGREKFKRINPQMFRKAAAPKRSAKSEPLVEAPEFVQDMADEVPEEEEVTERPPPAAASLGEEVTDKFPDAEGRELRVWKNHNKKYYISTEDAPATPLNRGGLTSQKEVQKFIDKWTKTHHKVED